MLTKLRNQSKFWMWIVGGAFILTIVFAWGMDYSGGGMSPVLGKVNGESIMLQEYQIALQNNYRQQQQQMGGREIDESMMEFIQEQTWQQLVSQKLVRQEISRMGFGASDEEIRFAIMYYPPSEIRQIPDFQTEGVFDERKYIAAMGSEFAREFWIQLEHTMRGVIPEQKLEQLIGASILITDAEARESFRYRNERVSASFVGLDPYTHVEEEVEVAEAEIREYYQANREDYRQPPRVDFNYVLIYKDASPQDMERIEQSIEDIRTHLEQGESFDVLARQYSDDPTASYGGDLGWIRRGDMVPSFEEAAFFLSIGEVSTSVRTQYGRHVVRVDSILAQGTEDEQRRVRHILFQEEASFATMDSISASLEQLREAARVTDFTTAAARMGLEVQQTGPVERDGFIPGIGFEPSVIRFGFSARVGEISEVREHTSAYYLVQVRDKLGEGYQPIEDVRVQIRGRLLEEKRMDMLGQRSHQLAERLKASPGRFHEIAETEGLVVTETGSISRDDFIAGVGREPQFIAAAFSTPIGEVAGPIRGRNSWYILKVTEHIEAAGADLQSVINAEKERIRELRIRSAFNQWLEGLRKEARVVDRRERYLW